MTMPHQIQSEIRPISRTAELATGGRPSTISSAAPLSNRSDHEHASGTNRTSPGCGACAEDGDSPQLIDRGSPDVRDSVDTDDDGLLLAIRDAPSIHSDTWACGNGRRAQRRPPTSTSSAPRPGLSATVDSATSTPTGIPTQDKTISQVKKGKITIDGNLADWAAREWLAVISHRNGGHQVPSPDLDVTASFAFDAEKLYLAVKALDDDVHKVDRSWRYGVYTEIPEGGHGDYLDNDLAAEIIDWIKQYAGDASGTRSKAFRVFMADAPLACGR